MVREGLLHNLTFEQRLVRYVRKEDMKTVGKVEGILSTKTCGRNGICSGADKLVTSPVTTLVLPCTCSQIPVLVVIPSYH